MSVDPERRLTKVRLISAGAFMSVLVASDLLFRFFCSFWPLVVYLAVGGLGWWRGEGLHRRFSADSFGSRLIRRGATCLAAFSFVGIIALTALPVNWDTKCAWRYCSRALGPGLFRSPFPVGAPACRRWNLCINEAPFSSSQRGVVLRRMKAQGCPAP